MEQTRGQVLGRLDEYWLYLAASIEDLAVARISARNPRTLLAMIRKQADLMKEQTELVVRVSRLGGAGDPIDEKEGTGSDCAAADRSRH